MNRARLTTAVAIASSALSLPAIVGCDETSQSYSALAIPRISERTPGYVKLDDSTMIAVVQKEGRIFFYKNSSGYGEGGVSLDAVVLSFDADKPSGNVYSEINALEALAYVGNDWEVIVNALKKQREQLPNTVEAELVAHWLEPLVRSQPEHTYPGERGYDNLAYLPLTHAQIRMGETEDDLWENYHGASKAKWITTPYVPVFLKLDDGTLLRISQRPHLYENKGMDGLIPFNSDSVIQFHRTFPGYAVGGAKGSIKGIGGGAEVPISNLYVEINPYEALAYFDGDIDRIYNAVLNQYYIVHSTIDPNAVKDTLLGDLDTRQVRLYLSPPERPSNLP